MRLKIRDNGIDREVYDYVFNRKYHVPFRPLKNTAPVILDLGANIGFSIVDLKMLYPQAKIIAYELDSDNYKLAQSNCKKLKEVYIVNKGVWFENAVLTYNKTSNADAYKLEQPRQKENFISVDTVTIDQIIKDFNLKLIDYVKMDIEGAEKQIFEHSLSWLKIVNQIKIEVHDGAEVFDFIKSKLDESGFISVKDTHHWSTIIGYRE